MTAPKAYRYRSPLRPLDFGYAVTEAGARATPDWGVTEFGQWTPTMVYGFTEPLAARVVSQWSLEVLE